MSHEQTRRRFLTTMAATTAAGLATDAAEAKSRGRVRLGVNTLLWSASNAEDARWVRKAHEQGFEGIEIAVFDPAAVDKAAVKDALDDTGLSLTLCTIMTPERDLIAAEREPREVAMKYIRDTVLLGEGLGATAFGGPHYAPVGKLVGRGRTRAEWDRAVIGFKELGQFAYDHGVTLCIEPLNRFETYFINIAEDAARMVDEVDSPGLKMMLDTFHMNIEEKDLGAAIRASGDRLHHFHACENDRGTPGTGNVDWREVFDALKDIGYRYSAVIESFVPGIKEIAAAAAIWRDIEPSADDISTGGLAFLRKSGL